MSSRAVMFLLSLIVVCASMGSQQKNSLNGKHLRVIVMEFPLAAFVKRNATGHFIDYDGVLINHLVALSTMFNFSFSYVLPAKTENLLVGQDGFSYIISNEADYYLSTQIALPSRLKQLDYPASFLSGPFGSIVPYPNEHPNIQATLKPFTYEVWITTVCAALAIGLYLTSAIQLTEHSKSTNKSKQIADFVLGNLVSQGQRFFSGRIVIRLAAGAWCAGCFFLVQIYCSTLTSHLTASNQKPIANTISELANTPGLSFTADKGFALDVLIKSTEIEDFKRLADKFRTNPKLLCNVTADCLKIVKGGNAAYGAPLGVLKMIMDNDLKLTGNCNYYLMKEKYLSTNAFTILPKNSPYTEIISIGILRFQQFGFYDEWFRWYLREPRKCMELQRHPKNIQIRLSISHMSSAFVILLVGYTISVSIFIIEKLFEKIL